MLTFLQRGLLGVRRQETSVSYAAAPPVAWKELIYHHSSNNTGRLYSMSECRASSWRLVVEDDDDKHSEIKDAAQTFLLFQ